MNAIISNQNDDTEAMLMTIEEHQQYLSYFRSVALNRTQLINVLTALYVTRARSLSAVPSSVYCYPVPLFGQQIASEMWRGNSDMDGVVPTSRAGNDESMFTMDSPSARSFMDAFVNVATTA